MSDVDKTSAEVFRKSVTQKRPTPTIGKVLLAQPLSFKLITLLFVGVFVFLVLALNLIPITKTVTIGGQIQSIASSELAPDFVAVFKLPPKNLDAISTGAPVSIELPAFPREQFGTLTGSISTIASQAELDGGLPTYTVTVALNEDRFIKNDRELRFADGIAASATIPLKSQSMFDWIKDSVTGGRKP